MQKQAATSEHTGVAHDEQILVVSCANLFPSGPWQGLKRDGIQEFISRIERFGEFKFRSEMEHDAQFKQIIPYLIFTHKNSYFLMQRKATATEQRLKNKLSLGIGGHVRQEDMHGASVFEWAWREFHEEIEYQGNVKITTLGLLNDDSNSVGQVHMGLVLLVEGNTSKISIKSELKEGNLLSLDECIAFRDQMESWSQIALNLLLELRQGF